VTVVLTWIGQAGFLLRTPATRLPGDGDAVRYLGYVVDTPAGRLYHSGDTVRWPGDAELLGRHRVDLALLPINGRDEEREARDIVGNLDAGEALASPATPPSGRWCRCTTT